MKSVSFLIVLLLLSFTVSTKAQDIDIGVFGGGSYYLGELNPSRQFFMTRPAYGGLVRFNLNTRMAIRGQILRGTIAGDDAISKINPSRNLRFTSAINEISVIYEFNYLDYFSGSRYNFFSPFLFAGPAIFTHNPKSKYQGETVELRLLGTEGQSSDKTYSLIGVGLAFGAGFRYSASQRLGLSVEWGLRKTTTDYLDDVSKNYYIDFSQLQPQDIGAREFLSDPSPVKHLPGMQRGNPANKDWYSFAGITLTYRFTIGEKTTCPHFHQNRGK